MGNYENLKAAIADVITTNGNNEITGAALRQVLQTIVSSIGGNSTFGGVVTPETNVGTPDQNVFYIAKTPGVYQYMGGITVGIGEIVFFTNTNNQWVSQTIESGEIFSNINDRLTDINNNIIYNLQPATALAIQEVLKIPFSQHGYIKFADGEVSAAGLTSGATPYISVEGVEKVHTTSIVSGIGAKIAFYDKELNYLQNISISGADTNTDYVFTEEQKNAAYFRVSYYGSNDYDKTARSVLEITFSDGRIPTKNLIEDISDLEFNSKGLTFTDYFDLANSNFAKYKLHRVSLKAGSAVVFKLIESDATLNLVITYKDSSFSAIASDIRTGSVIEFTPEKDVEYFGYYLYKVEGNSNAGVTMALMPRQVFDIDKFTDKPQLDILIFGDSITQSHATIEYKSVENPYSINVSGLSGTTWAKILEQAKQPNNSYRLGEIRNYAKSGASFRDRLLEPRQYLGFQIDEAFADLNAPEDGYYHNKPFSPDVVIVSMGTNDGTPASADTYDSAMSKSVMKDVVVDGVARQQIDIQATLNNLDTKSTIGEALRHSYMRLREQFPDALFVYATPIQRLAYETPPTQLELFKSLANRYNFVIADCNSESGIVRDFQTWDGSSGDLKDGLHPTENGSKKILRCIMDTVINNIQYLPL